MKIAVYDKWLSTLGGGEKVATVIAEVLSRAGHKVDLISNFEINREQIEEKMGVNLSRVNLCAWYERSYLKLSPLTKKYDLFINVSFLDHLPSVAKKSVYYIHFPTPIRTTFLGLIKYEALLPFFRRFLIIPEVSKGISPVDDVYTRGGRWLSKTNTIVFSNTPKKLKLTLRIYAEQLSLKTLNKISFGSANSELSLLDKYVDHSSNVLVYKLLILSKDRSPVIKIHIKEDSRINGLGLVSMTARDPRFLLWNIIKRYLPRYEMALYGSSSYKVGQGLDTYGLFLSNSSFTKKWTKKYWGKESSVLFPPVDVDNFKPGEKTNTIINVGRFFVGGHSKRQDILLSAFKSMIDKGILDKSWKLILVGGVAAGKEHTDYIDKLTHDASGYPIKFLYSPSFRVLKKIYSEAKIYWHATGYGVDENLEPIKTEHFGITPVEAMSAGAVPLVYKAGGLAETVGDDELTWKTIEELQEKTSKLISNKKHLKQLSDSMRKRADTYSRENFAKHLIKYLDL